MNASASDRGCRWAGLPSCRPGWLGISAPTLGIIVNKIEHTAGTSRLTYVCVPDGRNPIGWRGNRGVNSRRVAAKRLIPSEASCIGVVE